MVCCCRAARKDFLLQCIRKSLALIELNLVGVADMAVADMAVADAKSATHTAIRGTKTASLDSTLSSCRHFMLPVYEDSVAIPWMHNVCKLQLVATCY